MTHTLACGALACSSNPHSALAWAAMAAGFFVFAAALFIKDAWDKKRRREGKRR